MSATDEANEVRNSAYQVGAWHSDGPSHGPQCSANGEFCFLCAFRESGSSDDVCSDLKAMVRIMVQQNKELPVIVDAVHANYNANIRSEVSHKMPTGVIVEAPEWSKTSIQTHLVFSTEFEGLFENVVTHIHQSVIMHLNAKMLKSTGHVDEEARKALVDTVASLTKWKRKHNKM